MERNALFSFTRVSMNRKLGPIPAVMSSKDTCPKSCPLKGNGCYAEYGPMATVWKKHTIHDLSYLLSRIKALPRDTLWRYGVAGDLPGDGTSLDTEALNLIVKANKNKRGFCYTHYSPSAELDQANKEGFTINLSADSLVEADSLANDLSHRLPIVTMASTTSFTANRPVTYTPEGRRVILCPAIRNTNITCSTCGICAKPNRTAIVGFTPHGAGKSKAEAIVRSASELRV